MWAVTAWALATWLKTSLALACLGATIVELYVTRQLIREWCSEARMSWWWSP